MDNIKKIEAYVHDPEEFYKHFFVLLSTHETGILQDEFTTNLDESSITEKIEFYIYEQFQETVTKLCKLLTKIKKDNITTSVLIYTLSKGISGLVTFPDELATFFILAGLSQCCEN
jgi:hypothetical protein